MSLSDWIDCIFNVIQINTIFYEYNSRAICFVWNFCALKMTSVLSIKHITFTPNFHGLLFSRVVSIGSNANNYHWVQVHSSKKKKKWQRDRPNKYETHQSKCFVVIWQCTFKWIHTFTQTHIHTQLAELSSCCYNGRKKNWLKHNQCSKHKNKGPMRV